MFLYFIFYYGFLTLVAATNAVQLCSIENIENPKTENLHTKDILMDGRFYFSLDTLKILSEINTHGNIFFSPHSLYQALLLLYLGAGNGTTESTLKQVLHIPETLSKSDVQMFYASENFSQKEVKSNSSVLPSLSSLSIHQNDEYTIANRLWIKNTVKLRKCKMSSFLNKDFQQINFHSDPDAARNEINQWVSNVTKGNIRDLIPPHGISYDTDLVLTNAMYFKGLWKSRFNPENTRKNIFYQTTLNNGSLTDFMQQKGIFNHMVSEELGAHILQMPYKGDDISMFIFLPPFVTAVQSLHTDTDDVTSSPTAHSLSAQDGLIQLIQRISNTSSGLKEFYEILRKERMEAKTVQVQIPKFSLDQELSVSQLAEVLNIENILTTKNVADLREFVEDSEERLYIGDAVHRAKIEITEDGTTASAATALFSFRSSSPATGPAIFLANHPFLYIVYHHTTRSILFNGIFRKLTKKSDGD